MQSNIILLSKKAIDAALNQEWDLAVKLNLEILEKNPSNKDAKTRLGRAYIKLEKFSSAKRIFKELLELDPINQIALKNYKLASEKNSEKGQNTELFRNAKALIKEPGTTTQVVVDADRRVAKNMEPGNLLGLKITKNKITFSNEESGSILGVLEDETAKTVYKEKDKEIKLAASIIKVDDNFVTILLKSRLPIFKAEKQLEKPYMKGVLDENESEEEEAEEVVEE